MRSIGTCLAALVLLVLSALLVSPPAAQAANCTVYSDKDDNGSFALRTLIANASCATINFDGDYTIRLASMLEITRSLTIDGVGHTVVLSGDTNNDGYGEVPVMAVQAGATVTLRHLTVSKGYNVALQGFGGIVNQGTLTLTNVILSDNTGAALGGGAIANLGTLTVLDSSFTNNRAVDVSVSLLTMPGAGGGIAYLTGSNPVTVQNTTFSGNTASRGGGIYNAQGTLTVSGSTFLNNTATGAADNGGGGAIVSSVMTVTNSTFTGNRATGAGAKGGAIGGANFMVSGSTFTGNGATSGGAIAGSRSVMLSGNTFTGNSATASGGGIYVWEAAPFVVSDSTFTANSAPDGGGIYAEDSLPNVFDNTFSGNSATNGGGIHHKYLFPYPDAAAPRVFRNTFAGNSATGSGGAIYSELNSPYPYTFVAANNTFSGNGAPNGGGIYLKNSSTGFPTPPSYTLALKNNTFSGNRGTGAGGAGAIALSAGGVLDAANNLLLKGTAGSNCSGVTGSGGSNNLADDASCPAGFGVTTAAQVLLGPLGNYGGSTSTFPLLPGSPAIDAGDDVACANAESVGNLDQRMIIRPQGAHCDIGAFESRGFTLTNLTGTPQSTQINVIFFTPLGLTVTPNGSGEPVNGGKVTFTAPTAGPSTTFAPQTTATIASGGISLALMANSAIGGPYNVVASAAGASPVIFLLTNDKISSTMLLVSVPNPSTYGEMVVFTATLSVAHGSATGTVTFYENLPLGPARAESVPSVMSSSNVVPLTNFKAVFSTSALAIGSHSIVAVYSGDAVLQGSTSNAVNQTVNVPPATVVLVSALNPSTYGQGVTLNATVSSTLGIPTGAVAFRDNGVAIADCGAVSLSGGQAACTTAALAAGSHALSAVYQTSTSNTVTQVVNPKSISGSITVANKTYDGSTAATIAGRTLTGALAGDDVSLSGGTATFDTAAAGTGKIVTAVGLTLGGTAAGNYTLQSATATTTADILPRALTASGIAADDKTYDGRSAATLKAGAGLVGAILGDAVALDASGAVAAFADRHVGMNKPVSVSGLALSGADAANYTLPPTAATVANINQLRVMVNATTDSKMYDGTTASSGAPYILEGGIIEGDTAIWTQTFDTEDAGTGKTMVPAGTVNDGNGGNNYYIVFWGPSDGVITPAPLTVTVNDETKVYGAALPAFGVTYSGFVNGESEIVLGGARTFDTSATQTSAVGDYDVTPAGLTAANYGITFVKGTLHITAAGTTTTLGGPAGAVQYGDPIHLVANVAAVAPGTRMPTGVGMPIPTGSVTFAEGGTTLCANVPLDAMGAASCDLAAGLPLGTRSFKATYGGETNWQGSIGNLDVVVQGTIPVVLTDPASQTVNAGQTATFNAAASGNPFPTMQWWVSTDGGKSWSEIPATNWTGYEVSTDASMNGYQYKAVFTNAAGSATSNIATLTVQFAPTITTQPLDQSANDAAPVTFATAADGNPAPAAQWQVSMDGVSWDNIPGETGATLSFNASLAKNGYKYQVVYTNSVGSVTSKAATLMVRPAADLSVSMATDALPADSKITYVITVQNLGPSAAQEVMLNDLLPDGTNFVSADSTLGTCKPSKGKALVCTLGTLENAQSATITLVVKRIKYNSDIVNTASVKASTADPVAGNNMVSVTVAKR